MTKSKWPVEKIIIGYVGEELSMGRIASILECSKSIIFYHLKKTKIKTRRVGRRRKLICSLGKYCSVCKRLKPLTDYAIATHKLNGHKSECKKCKNSIYQERKKNERK